MAKMDFLHNPFPLLNQTELSSAPGHLGLLVHHSPHPSQVAHRDSRKPLPNQCLTGNPVESHYHCGGSAFSQSQLEPQEGFKVQSCLLWNISGSV